MTSGTASGKLQSAWSVWRATLAASPAFAALLLIHCYGVNFHFWDEWHPGLAGLFASAAQHRTQWGLIFSQHNEHRIAIPRLVYLMLNPITHWNNLGNLYFAWGMVCSTSLIVFHFSNWSADERPGKYRRAWGIWFLCNLLIFTPVQEENWLWGMGLANFMPTLLIFAALCVAISRWSLSWRVTGCVLLSAAATYSSGNGVLAWPLVGAILIGGAARQDWKRILGVWIVACAVFVGLYHLHYSRPAGDPRAYSRDPVDIALYTLAFAGNPFGVSTTYQMTWAAITFGAIELILLLLVAVYFVRAMWAGRREICLRMGLWFSVAAYGVLSGLIASFFRAGYGAHQALSPRYASYAIYIPVALINLIWIVCRDRPDAQGVCGGNWLSSAAGVLAGAMVMLEVLSVPMSLTACEISRVGALQGKGALLLANILPDNPRLAKDVCSDPAAMKSEANALNDAGYLQPPLIATDNPFAIMQSDPGERGTVAGYMDGVKQTAPGDWTLTGWAAYPKTRGLVDDVILTYQDRADRPVIVASAQMSIRRDDVAEKFGVADFIRAGWVVTLNADRIPSDVKPIRVRAWALNTDDGRVEPLLGGAVLPR